MLTLYQASRADGVVIDGNREALRNLEWIYLKLLVAESHLRSNVSGEDERQLRQRIGDLEADLKKQPESPEEEALCKEAKEGCPVEAIGDNGP